MRPVGYVDCQDDGAGGCIEDCDDANGGTWPGAPDYCDGVDNDCDGQLSLGDTDADQDGLEACAGDCDDLNSDVRLGAPEICDGVDNNCNGTPDIDEVDDDGDGYLQCEGVDPRAQLLVVGRFEERLTLFPSDFLSFDEKLLVSVEASAGATEAITEAGSLVTVTFVSGVSTTDSLRAMVLAQLQSTSLTTIGRVTGSGQHPWSGEEVQSRAVFGTQGDDCDDTDPLVSPGGSETNGAGAAFCDGQDSDCNGVLHPRETDDDLDGWAECTPSTQGGPGGEELILGAPVSVVTASPRTVTFAAGSSAAVSENVGSGTLTVTFVSGTSTTDSLASMIAGALGGLTLIDSVSGSGTTPWSNAEAGDVFLGLLAGGDCNDSNDEVAPTLPELCDGYDNDCDGLVGDGTGGTPDEMDVDGDGFVACTPNSVNLSGTVLGMAGGDDCQDDPFDPNDPLSVAAATIYPGAPEVADSYYDGAAGTYVLIDNQCPGDVGYDANGIPGAGEYCQGPTTSAGFSCIESELDLDGDDYSPANGDCDDTNGQIGPQMLEICDGFDNDCDTVIPGWELDDDGDGWLVCNPAAGVMLAGGLVGGGDCADGNATVNPGEIELPDGLDTDCDASTNAPAEVDGDGDGYCPGSSCNGSALGGDCDDGNPYVNPGASELCDGLDTDCDGLLSDGSGNTLDEVDDDGDGYTVCDPSSGAAVVDCLEHPAQILAAFPTYPVDATGAPVNWMQAAASVHPSSPEVCDGWNNDCSGGTGIPSATEQSDEYDDDGDGFVDCLDSAAGVVGWTTTSIVAQANQALFGGNDCADLPTDTDDPNNPNDGPNAGPLTSIYPGATELCDSWDNSCLGSNPPFVGPNSPEWDDDLDRYLECAQVTITTGAVNTNGDTILGGYDCLDDPSTDSELPAGIHPATGQPVTLAMAASVNPGRSEVCDGWNTDCDTNGASAGGQTLMALPTAADTPSEVDEDSDSFIECSNFVATGAPGMAGEDCLDVSLAINAYSDNVNPAAFPDTLAFVASSCDGWDTDCSNQPAWPNNDGEPCGDDGLCPGESGYPGPDAGEDDLDEFDADGDGYIQCGMLAAGAFGNGPSVGSQTQVMAGGDCLDVPVAVNPRSDDVNPGGAADFQFNEATACDGWDTDCTNQPAYPANDGEPCGYDGLCPGEAGYPGPDGGEDDLGEFDADGDGYIACSMVAVDAAGNGPSVGSQPQVLAGGDCLDELLSTNPYSDDVNPAATETCDSWDTDCDSQPAFPNNDGEAEDADERDQDGDGYVRCALVPGAVGNGFGGAVGGGDCLDVPLASNPYSDDVNPAATEFCDSWDTDCDSQPSYPANDGLPERAEEIDDDGDGYVQCDFPGFAFAGGALNNGYGGVVMGSDCLDVLLTINPYSDDVNPGAAADTLSNAAVACDGWDTDCSNQPAWPNNDGEPCGNDGLCPGEAGYTSPDAGEDDLGEFDADGDGYIECAIVASNAAGNGPAVGSQVQVFGGADCLDELASVNPYASSVNPAAGPDTLANITVACDGWDTDCSNQPAWPNNDGEPCGNDGLCPGEAGYTSPDAGEDDLDEFDADGDGYIACFSGASSAPSLAPGAVNNGPAVGTQTQVVGAGDCLDELLATSPYSDDVNPAATEFCDSWDTDCDSQPSYPANDGLPERAEEIDDDGDGYVQCDFPGFAFAGGALNNGYGGVVMGSDCLDVLLTINPYSDDVNPGEVEVCDSWDTDCSSQSAYPSNDGAPDDAGETDQDGDGYVPCDYNAAANNGGAESNGYGSVIDGGDCLDMAPAGNPYAANVNPGSLSDTLANVASTCDGWDTDCSNQPAYPNNDGEPCGNDGLCPGEAGYTSPDAGEDDLGEFDADGDGYIACFNGPSSAPSLAPGAANNGPAVGTQTQVVGAGDCLDELLATSPYSDDVNPAATETCDSWDTDCDSQPGYPNNDGLPEAAEENDDDADGYVQCDYSGVALARGALNNGYGGVVMGSDCLDVSLATNAYSDNVNPGEVETCDSWDTDCSGQPPWPSNDGAPDDPDEVDDDGDTYIHCDFSAAAANGGAIDNGYGTVIDGGDCLDETTASNPYADNVNPAATEICDSFDTDCSNQSPYPGNDGEPEDADERDQDGDGYIQCDLSTGAIVGGALGNGFGGVFAGGDCLDVSLSTNAYSDDVNPAATEICDSWDTDCNSQPSYPGNDGTPEDPDEIDDDSDGYFECDLVAGAAGNTRNGALGGDCLDEVGGLSYPLANAADPSITFAQAGAVNPGASEVCDGFDTDCSSGNTVFVVDPVQEPNEYDADFDDHMICASLQSWTPIGLLGGDCDNNLATGSGINPSVAPDDYSSPLTDNDCDGLYDEDAWSAGDLAITEVMVDPGGGSTEWFEVYNQSGRTLSLQGLVLSDQGSESWTLSEDSRIGNGDYAILCAMPFAYPGGSGGYASGCLNGVGFFSFTLSNGSDEIVLSMAGATIDVVAWTSSASNTTDASTGLDPNATPYETANTTLNLASADWCQSSNAWPGGGGAMGSPGVQNQPCNLSSMDLDGDGFCADGRDTRGVGAGSPPDGDCDDPGEQSTSNYDCFDDGADAYASNVNTASFEVCDGYDTDCSNSGVPPRTSRTTTATASCPVTTGSPRLRPPSRAGTTASMYPQPRTRPRMT